MKLHKKYETFVKHTGRYSIITGGRGSGKSFAVVNYVIKLTFEEGHKIQMLRLTRASSGDSTISLASRMIEQMGLSEYFIIHRYTITNKLSGSSIVFDGFRGNTSQNSARNKGKDGFTTIVFEEAEEFTDESEFKKADLGLREGNKDLRIILLLNPTTKEHWIYQRFYLRKQVNEGFNGVVDNVCYVHTTYKDIIKHLPKSILDVIEEERLFNPNYYKHAILGGWLEKAEGVIYSNWEYGEFPKDVDTYFGADWGSTDPTTLIEVAIDEKEKCIYLKEHLYTQHLTNSQLISIFKKKCGDKLIIGDSSEPRTILELKNAGLNIKGATKGAGSILEGIKLIQDYKLIVDKENSNNLFIELSNYAWNKKTQTPKGGYDHLMDAMRYIISDLIKPNMKTGVYHIY